jgi:Mg2+-importing ATPase
MNASGLTSAAAAAELARVGPNEVGTRSRSWLHVLLAQLWSPLLGLLLVAAVVSVGVGERVDGGVILAIMALSVGLGFVNEFRSERTLEALRERTGRRATVIRDGERRELFAAELVPGDLCVLQIGDVVPADLRLTEAWELTVDESTFTGEPFPVERRSQEQVFLGTIVRGGHAFGLVEATGARTRLGGIAGGLVERQPPTAFQRGLSAFVRLLAVVTGVLTVFIFVCNSILGRPVLDALLFSLAIAVGLTPQLLPAIVTVSLTTGARRMARRAVLVKRLVAIEDLGDADVLFTDKTGTLTEGEIRLREAVSPDGAPAPELVRLGLLCSDLQGDPHGTPLGNALDLAIWRALEPAVANAELATAKRLAALPFSFERRRTTAVLDLPGGMRLVCKGAAEEILSCCSETGAGRETLERLLARGHRVLALADRPATGPRDLDESRLELRGFLVFADPPKPDAADSITRLQRLGIELKVLTGDHELTAAHVCAELGLPVKGIVRGEELDGLDAADLQRLVRDTTVFARVSPDQKAALVAAAQRNGDDVAFLGDGVNDAIALHQADVGISVESAVDVAKEAADVLLLEKSLGVLADGVVEGRRVFANTTKYVLMGTSSNFGNMFSAAGASLFLSFLPMLPSQILLNNLLYDCSELTIPTDTVDEELLARPEHWDIGFIRRFMLFFGPISSLRLCHLRHPPLGLPRTRATLPLRLVRRIARHPGARRLRHPHPPRAIHPQSSEQPAAARHPRCGRARGGPALHAARPHARLPRPSCRPARGDRRPCRYLPGARRTRQGLLLPLAQASISRVGVAAATRQASGASPPSRDPQPSRLKLRRRPIPREGRPPASPDRSRRMLHPARSRSAR